MTGHPVISPLPWTIPQIAVVEEVEEPHHPIILIHATVVVVAEVETRKAAVTAKDLPARSVHAKYFP